MEGSPQLEQIIASLKLAIASQQLAPPRDDGRSPSARTVQLASTLADLCAAGLPLDIPSICAGILADVVHLGLVKQELVARRVGTEVAVLVHDILQVRDAPARIETYDDEAASAVREWCLACHDVRATVVALIVCWDELQHMSVLPYYEQQALALEALQIYAPLGHALGLGPLSALMEDLCFKVLFPGSYTSTSHWLRTVVDPAEDALFACQQRLISSLHEDPTFMELAAGCVVKARTKSLFSIMKKLLRLGEASRGTRTREEIYDLLGMRAIVLPRVDMPRQQAEEKAVQACYMVQEVASRIWPAVPGRTKDYITYPKDNGYQSIHLTLQMGALDPQASAAYDQRSLDTMDALDPEEQEVSGAPAAMEPGGAGGARESHSLMAQRVLNILRSVDGDHSEGDVQQGRGETGMEACVSDERYVRLSRDALDVDLSMSVPGWLCMELQIRTQAMDAAAESGEAAHTAYKGGLDAQSARQLQSWTRELTTRLRLHSKGRLLLRAASQTLADDPTPIILLPDPLDPVAPVSRSRQTTLHSPPPTLARSSASPDGALLQAHFCAMDAPLLAPQEQAPGLAWNPMRAVDVQSIPLGLESPVDQPLLRTDQLEGAGKITQQHPLLASHTTRASRDERRDRPSRRLQVQGVRCATGATCPAAEASLDASELSIGTHSDDGGAVEAAAWPSSSPGVHTQVRQVYGLQVTAQQGPQQQQLEALPLQPLMPDFTRVAAEQLFRVLDHDGDGFISSTEIQEMLVDLHAPAAETDTAALIAALDRDADGVVSLEEFVLFQHRISTTRPK